MFATISGWITPYIVFSLLAIYGYKSRSYLLNNAGFIFLIEELYGTIYFWYKFSGIFIDPVNPFLGFIGLMIFFIILAIILDICSNYYIFKHRRDDLVEDRSPYRPHETSVRPRYHYEKERMSGMRQTSVGSNRSSSPQVNYCSTCGNEIKSGDSFCMNCGRYLLA